MSSSNQINNTDKITKNLGKIEGDWQERIQNTWLAVKGKQGEPVFPRCNGVTQKRWVRKLSLLHSLETRGITRVSNNPGIKIN